jgi:hypothetical protein
MYQVKDVLSYYVLDDPIREEENLTKGGLPVYLTAEWNCYKGMKVHWVVTSPNHKGIPKLNLGIRSLFAKSNRCYGLDD